MIEQTYQLGEFIQATLRPAKDLGWPTPSPFNLSFSAKKLAEAQYAAIKGSGIYMISYGPEVVYLGLYKPVKGDIISDRWGRHLQTITGRGHNIGLGGRNPGKRRDDLLEAVDAPDLRGAIENAFLYSRDLRFRDSGNNTTPNRLRFASENWDHFATMQPGQMLRPIAFWLHRIHQAEAPGLAARHVKIIEAAVLANLKFVCNKEYTHNQHHTNRGQNTVERVSAAIRQSALNVTGSDISHRIQLAGPI